MKKLSTISLFIFGVIVTAILVAGLVFYQNNKNKQVVDLKPGNLVQETVKRLTFSGQNVILNMSEISKHNKSSDCWMLISGKVYDITSYFGSHPGGNGPMAATCGTDATMAYMTKDPNANSNTKGKSHSSNAQNLLTDYYLGDLNQTIGIETSTSTNPKQVSPQDNLKINSTQINLNQKSNIIPPENITLDMAEISKHNKVSDCWYLINNKVYNITSFFGSHPGGNSIMAPSCGTDATTAYMTKDPTASTSGNSSAHSSNAINMLANYYIGDLNQTIGQQKIVETNNIISKSLKSDDDEENEDD